MIDVWAQIFERIHAKIDEWCLMIRWKLNKHMQRSCVSIYFRKVVVSCHFRFFSSKIRHKLLIFHLLDRDCWFLGWRKSTTAIRSEQDGDQTVDFHYLRIPDQRAQRRNHRRVSNSTFSFKIAKKLTNLGNFQCQFRNVQDLRFEYF